MGEASISYSRKTNTNSWFLISTHHFYMNMYHSKNEIFTKNPTIPMRSYKEL